MDLLVAKHLRCIRGCQEMPLHAPTPTTTALTRPSLWWWVPSHAMHRRRRRLTLRDSHSLNSPSNRPDLLRGNKPCPRSCQSIRQYGIHNPTTTCGWGVHCPRPADSGWWDPMRLEAGVRMRGQHPRVAATPASTREVFLDNDKIGTCPPSMAYGVLNFMHLMCSLKPPLFTRQPNHLLFWAGPIWHS